MSKIEGVLKCDICNKNFDISNKRPYIAKCGHSFCKLCILSNNKESNNCPICNIQSVLSIESCIPNLKLEEVIRIIILNNEEKINDKKIIYQKPEIKRNKSPIQKNEISVSHKTLSVYNKGKIRSSTVNKYTSEFKFNNNEPIFFGNSSAKIKNEKIDFEDSKINDEINESIETIPANNDDKNIINLSFKDEMKMILKKNTIEKKDNNNNELDDNIEKNNQNKIKKNESNNKKNNNYYLELDESLDKISRIDDEFLTSNINNNKHLYDININFMSTATQLISSPTDRESDKQENLKIITKNINLDFQRINNNINSVYYKIKNNNPFLKKSSENNSINSSKEKYQTTNLTPKKYIKVFGSNSNTKNETNNSEQINRYSKNKSLVPYKNQLIINNSNSSNLTSMILNNNIKTDRIREEKNEEGKNEIKEKDIKIENNNIIKDNENYNKFIIKKSNSHEKKKEIKNIIHSTKIEPSISSCIPKSDLKLFQNNIQKSKNNLSLSNKLIGLNNSRLEDKIYTLNKIEISIDEIKEKLINELNSQNPIPINYNKYIENIEKSLSNEKLINKETKQNIKNLKLKLNQNKDLIIGFQNPKTLNIKYGIQYSQNGDYYIGEFLNNKKNGNGISILKNGTRYEGSFKNNKHDGYGKLIQIDGEIFAGEWKEGKIEGNGIRYHNNGDKYIGNYKNNLKHGKGNYIFSNGNSYDGNWENGKANGIGKFIFKNGNFYEGEFKDNIICGKGVFNMKNGDSYIGNFKNGLINGKGVYKNYKGDKYTGYFFNGKKHGFGKLVDKNGNLIVSGYWNMDKFIEKKDDEEFI